MAQLLENHQVKNKIRSPVEAESMTDFPHYLHYDSKASCQDIISQNHQPPSTQSTSFTETRASCSYSPIECKRTKDNEILPVFRPSASNVYTKHRAKAPGPPSLWSFGK